MLRLLGYLLARFTTIVYLMRHPGVPPWLKLLPVIAVAYVVFPHDFLKDTLPVVGWMDDIWVFFILMTIFTALGGALASRQQKRRDAKTITTRYEVLEEGEEGEDEEKP